MSVRFSVDDGIAEVMLDHPPVNALDSAGWEKLAETIIALGEDETVRVIVLGAEGRGFCAGVDVKELAKDSSLITKVNDDASFGLPEIDRGALGAASHLMRMFPVQKVRKMLFTGEPISAQEAYRLGALEAIVPRDRLMPEARGIATSLAAKSPKAMRLAKESLNGIELLDIKRSYRYEQGFTLELYTSPDSQEARDAFVEKREASFSDTKEE
jgi:enoyl-CoA hydratase